MLVAPIGAPMANDYSDKVWLPSRSEWYEWHTGTLLKGCQVVERKFSILEYPIYVKAEAIDNIYYDVDIPFYVKAMS